MPSEIQNRIDAIIGATAPLPSAAEFARLLRELQNKQQFSLASQLLGCAITQLSASLQDSLASSALAARDVAARHDSASLFAAQKEYSLLWLIQQKALCTYKDPNRVAAERFNSAIALLNQVGLANPATSNSETLALGAAVYKRAWEQQGLQEDLLRSLTLYEAGWSRNNSDPDSCYCADQAAFIYDMLAARMGTPPAPLAAQDGALTIQGNASTSDDSTNDATAYSPLYANQYRLRAQRLRRVALAEMQRRQQLWPDFFKQDRFSLLTRANLQLGLGLVDTSLLPAAVGSFQAVVAQITQTGAQAGTASGQTATDLEEQRLASEWAIQEAFRQAMALTRLHHYLPPECDPGNPGDLDGDAPNWALVEPVFQALLGKDSAAAHTYHRGKVGLALSGGGFRAAFYHIGVMTRMAEVDALRSVEVLSTVSGGSVLGAHYYLEVQQLLQSKADQDLTRQDFIELMARVQSRFFSGVQSNITVRASASLVANWRMTQNDYSNSCRVGELYEEELYSRVEDGHPSGEPRTMPQLLIKPAGQSGFNPRYDNWRRISKVPILLLNATSFNTGHSWHFTASWMGEPPGMLKQAVDSTERYRRLYYHQAPTPRLQQFRLGYAVAASSSVPGIFASVMLPGLYPERTVNLHDGGVHDNQGLAGLLDEGCTRILCSDASGQMAEDLTPAGNMMGVTMRANAILQDRIRDVQYQDVRVRADNQSLLGLFFVHLKQGLDSAPVDWIGCDESAPRAATASTSVEDPACNITPYGIAQDLQRRIAAVRTDLDSFTEVEANALMMSGYLTSEQQFKALQEQHVQQGLPGTWGGYQIDAARGNWPFLQLEAIMRRPPNPQDEQRCELEKQLDVASMVYFKIWHLNPGLQWLAKGLGAVLALAILFFLYRHWFEPVAPILGKLNWGILMLLLFGPTILFSIGPIKRLLTPRTSAPGWPQKAVFGVLAAVIAKVHLALFENMFLEQGKMARLLNMKGPDRKP